MPGSYTSYSNPVASTGASNTSLDTHSTVDDGKVSVEINDLEPKKSPPSQQRRPSQWQRLKHMLQHSKSLEQEEPQPPPSLTNILPDDVEYIEGGDIVHADLSHDVSTSLSQQEAGSPVTSRHVLSPVQEEDGNRDSTLVGKASSQHPDGHNNSFNLETMKEGVQELPPVSESASSKL